MADIFRSTSLISYLEILFFVLNVCTGKVFVESKVADTMKIFVQYKFKYAEIRLQSYYILSNIRNAAAHSAQFLWTRGRNGGVKVYFLVL